MALTRNKPRIYSTVMRRNSQPLAAATAVLEGAAVGIAASSGRARSLVAGDIFAGFAATAASSVRDVTGSAPTEVQLVAEGEALLTVAGVTATSLGASVFATDDDTFALTGSSLVGEVLRVPAAGQAVVVFVGGRNRLSSGQVSAGQALVSGAWNAATSGTWRTAAIGALPRFSVSGGASGGTWALSYRNAAGTVTSDPAETVAAGITDVSPVYLDDATEIMVTITGTVTVEVK